MVLCMGLPTAIAPVELLSCAEANKPSVECNLVHAQD